MSGSHIIHTYCIYTVLWETSVRSLSSAEWSTNYSSSSCQCFWDCLFLFYLPSHTEPPAAVKLSTYGPNLLMFTEITALLPGCGNGKYACSHIKHLFCLLKIHLAMKRIAQTHTIIPQFEYFYLDSVLQGSESALHPHSLRWQPSNSAVEALPHCMSLCSNYSDSTTVMNDHCKPGSKD